MVVQLLRSTSSKNHSRVQLTCVTSINEEPNAVGEELGNKSSGVLHAITLTEEGCRNGLVLAFGTKSRHLSYLG